MSDPLATASEGAARPIPQWAKERARQLFFDADPRKCVGCAAPLSAWAENTFAAYIAAHEEPPADPLEQAIREEVERLKVEAEIECSRSGIAWCWAEKGLRRGVELAKSELSKTSGDQS